MTATTSDASIGVLVSGGLDSSILLADLLRRGRTVQPFYIRCGLFWQSAEAAALARYLAALASPRLRSLVTLDLPLADLYAGHWSITGSGTPDAHSADESVFLPGRNALLVIKPALWCQLHGLGELALGTLGTNPFPDATPGFFDDIEAALNRSSAPPVRLVRPLEKLDKRQVMQLGQNDPLEWTFSCIAPVRGLHCGDCNKCAERQAAFALIAAADPTCYAATNGKVK